MSDNGWDLEVRQTRGWFTELSKLLSKTSYKMLRRECTRIELTSSNADVSFLFSVVQN